MEGSKIYSTNLVAKRKICNCDLYDRRKSSLCQISVNANFYTLKCGMRMPIMSSLSQTGMRVDSCQRRSALMAGGRASDGRRRTDRERTDGREKEGSVRRRRSWRNNLTGFYNVNRLYSLAASQLHITEHADSKQRAKTDGVSTSLCVCVREI